jgi:hypothetical protein
MTAVEERPVKVRGFLAQAAASSGIQHIALRVKLATFRRKIGGFMNFDQWRDAKRSPSEWPTGSAGRKIAGADLWD